ncbi:hypothetical protein WJX72_002426 [[Myrmecia] bisecta]|uniref:Uncharacterized protein n=1 Tax=[Myrmecia] bisecta TaxID=41462 RepID=A0AAW1R6C5_9CHLO
MFELQWQDVRTGRPDAPHYATWWKWSKFTFNVVSAVLGVGILSATKGHASHSKIDGAFIFCLLVRLIEVVKDVVPLLDFRRGSRRCGTVVFCSVCHTREQAANVDKNIKYVSSIVLSPALAFLSLILFFLDTSNWGCLLLGILSAVDYLVAIYIIIVDECVKDRSLVRMRPNDIELDDSLEDPDADEESTAFTPHVSKITQARGQWSKLEAEYGQPVAITAVVSTQRSIGAYRSDSQPMHPDNSSGH